MIESMSAMAGMTPLYPPENPAMKCGSMKPSTMRLSASTYSRFMYTSWPSEDLPANASARVVGVVVHDAVVRDHLTPDHRDEFLFGVGPVGPVGACSVDDSDVLGRHMREFLEEQGQQATGGQGAGDVRDHDGDPVLGSNEFFERRGADGMAHRLAEGRRLVWQPLLMLRAQHGNLRRRDLHGQITPAVL
jgi:hypothetical protein